MHSKRALWLYPLFKIPLMALIACLVAATLCILLGLGRPNVAVAIALDLSNSTYPGQPFNAPGTVMNREIQAVRSYVQQNSLQLKTPNQIQIFGFAGAVQPLVATFQTDSQQLETELTKALKKPELSQAVQPNSTNLNLAVQKGIDSLGNTQNSCRELLLVTDGEAPLSADLITQAAALKIKINSVVVGADASALQDAAKTTQGIYFSDAVDNLEKLLTDQLFAKFNTNTRWIVFWLGCAWVALMWMLTLPLDRWIFQGWLKLPMNIAGQTAIGNAFFWSAATPAIVWRLASGIPFISQC